MTHPLRLAIVGLGRIGTYHARHALELAGKDFPVRLEAIMDPSEPARARARTLNPAAACDIQTFASITGALERAEIDAAVIASPTDLHREHAQTLISAGCRVLVEKPLTPSLEEDRAFAQSLESHSPDAVMLAFQRRFDAPLQYAKELLDRGRIGRPFKYVSVLEDSRLMPAGYQSPGLLADMSVHNVDEVLWLSGARPQRALATGFRLYSQALTPVEEDFDDALLQLWLDDGAMAQIQVSRNHVAGYRVETWIFGAEGVIHVGSFQKNPHEVTVETFGRESVLDRRTFALRDYEAGAPEFIDRFGDAYAAELASFIECCSTRAAFPVGHQAALAAMEVIAAGTHSIQSGGAVPL